MILRLLRTKIHEISPGICGSQGSDINISGHGFYSTSFQPKVKFIAGIREIIRCAHLLRLKIVEIIQMRLQQNLV